MEKRRQPEIIAGRVNSDGSIAAGDGFTVQKTATGNYVVTITAPGFRVVSVTMSAYVTAVTAFGGNSAPSATGFVAWTLNTAGSAVDGAWGFVAVGVQT